MHTFALAVKEQSHASLIQELEQALDVANAWIDQQKFTAVFQILGSTLSTLYDRLQSENLLETARSVVRAHPVFKKCHADPYTARAYQKPRGYAGDAVMLDYVYSGRPDPSVSSTGKGIFHYTTRGPMGLSVLFRKSLLNAYINDVVARNPHARILSVASGHCREIEGSLMMSTDFKGEFIAFDQDALSCAEVTQAYGSTVRTVEGNIKQLLSDGIDLGKFDLIYSAGLYDYLTDPYAVRLTESLKKHLKPESRLLIGNFSTSSFGRGYLDLIMDWRLVYRDEQAVRRVCGNSNDVVIKSFQDPHANVNYAEMVMKATLT